MFAVVNVCRMYNMLSEFTLNEATNKFIDRFEAMERDIMRQKKSFEEMSPEDMDIFWENAKKRLKKTK